MTNCDWPSMERDTFAARKNKKNATSISTPANWITFCQFQCKTAFMCSTANIWEANMGRSVDMSSEIKPRPDQMRKDKWRLFSHLSKTYRCGFAMHTGIVSTIGAPEDAQTQLNNLLFKSPVSLYPFFSLSQDQSDPDPIRCSGPETNSKPN